MLIDFGSAVEHHLIFISSQLWTLLAKTRSIRQENRLVYGGLARMLCAQIDLGGQPVGIYIHTRQKPLFSNKDILFKDF